MKIDTEVYVGDNVCYLSGDSDDSAESVPCVAL